MKIDDLIIISSQDVKKKIKEAKKGDSIYDTIQKARKMLEGLK